MNDDSLILPGPAAPLAGSMPVPTSKSYTNRALIAAAAADGGRILDPLDCEDTRLLAAALRTAGWDLSWQSDLIRVGPRSISDRAPVVVNLGNSGTGARLILGLLATVEGSFVVDGTPRLRQRPVGPLVDALVELGARVRTRNGGFPVTIDGHRLPGGAVAVEPRVSSQFITSLLLAAPLFDSGLELEVRGALPSAPYLGLTAEVLGGFGADFEYSPDFRHWVVRAKKLDDSEWRVEGDWSAAAFPLAAVATAGGSVEIRPLKSSSRQGDRMVCEILRRAGMSMSWHGDRLIARGPVSRAMKADLEDCPDAFPALAAVAACRLPGSHLTGLGNLIHKESDRLAAMTENLRQLGADLVVGKNDFRVRSVVRSGNRTPRPVRAAADHRIAMAMAVTALKAGKLLLDDPSCVGKSFPEFWDLWFHLVRSPSTEVE